ncbi:MAG: hypothetical protein AB1756_02255 [Acidobacteriota bacterium]
MMRRLSIAFLILLFSSFFYMSAADSCVNQTTQERIVQALLQKHGESLRFRIERGVKQAAQFWSKEDGGEEEFEAFCKENFIGDPEMLDITFRRLEMFNESVNGHFTEMGLDITRPLSLDWGDILPIDMLTGEFNPAAHLNEDLFKGKIAFIVLLNFPRYTLEEKSKLGPQWSNRDWAYALMGDAFVSRVPASILQDISAVMTKADTYISEYNIFMGKVVDDKYQTYFPEEMKLISHWNLRDELKARYADPEGLKKQKLIYQVMLRVISQEIPEEVINKNTYEWDPLANKLFLNRKEVPFKSEPDTRYVIFLQTHRAMKTLDPYYPDFPTHVSRMFDWVRKIPYAEVESMFIDLLSSRQVRETAKLVRKRLGRELKPFDIWYNGFTAKQSISEEELNRIVSEKYPTLGSFEKDIPNILVRLGFSKEQADFIAPKIQVDPARGAGHCAGAEMKIGKARLRTRVPRGGMDYKGFNIAMHELGHAVEQTLSLHKVDHYSEHGIPNTAFTEAFAFLFQTRDLDVLGLEKKSEEAVHLSALDTLWMTYEIMGVALVDMRAWKWLYEHPEAKPAQLKEAVISIAKDVWNKYYADVFEVKDVPILAIYSHMIDSVLYLPDYPIGHVIQFQMEKYLEGKNLGVEMERMCRSGSIIPQLWMEKAVGLKITAKPLLDAADFALAVIKK